MHPDPSSSSSSYRSDDPPPRAELLWDRMPSLKILRPPKGKNSPQVDERCFTYCSQSIKGRIHGNDPWCRTICLRHVFSHEVNRVLSHHRSQTVKREPGRPTVVTIKDEVVTTPVHHPLPPEGQRYSGWLSMLIGDRFDDPDDPHTTEGRLHLDPLDVRHWQEGWYLWWSTSRWAAQERLDLMRRDLQGQAEWQTFKDKKNEEWAKGAPLTDDGHPDASPFEDLGNAQPFPDVTSSSILLPLPSLPASFTSLSSAFGPVLAPTGKVLELVHDNYQSGAHKELMLKMWEKAQTDEPRKLLVVAFERIRETLMGGSKEGEGKPGNNGDSGKNDKR